MKKFFFFLIIFTSCKEKVFEYNPELNVYCILMSDRNIQKIRINRTYKMDEVSIYDLKDVNAILFLKHNDYILCDTLISDTLDIFKTIKNFEIYEESICSIIITASYKETLKLDTLFGKTIIPSSFNISLSSNNDTVNQLDTLIINDFSKDNQLYYIEVYFEMNNDIIFKDWVFDKLIPISKIIPSYFTGKYKIKIFKCDENVEDYYLNYYYDDKVLRSGVKGGVGLFGSMLVESVYVYTTE